MDVTIYKKRCLACLESKTHASFKVNKNCKDGLQSICTACQRAAVQPVEQEFQPKPIPDGQLVQPRTRNYRQQNYKPEDQGYIRNNGNKHVLSRGK